MPLLLHLSLVLPLEWLQKRALEHIYSSHFPIFYSPYFPIKPPKTAMPGSNSESHASGNDEDIAEIPSESMALAHPPGSPLSVEGVFQQLLNRMALILEMTEIGSTFMNLGVSDGALLQFNSVFIDLAELKEPAAEACFVAVRSFREDIECCKDDRHRFRMIALYRIESFGNYLDGLLKLVEMPASLNKIQSCLTLIAGELSTPPITSTEILFDVEDLYSSLGGVAFDICLFWNREGKAYGLPRSVSSAIVALFGYNMIILIDIPCIIYRFREVGIKKPIAFDSLKYPGLSHGKEALPHLKRSQKRMVISALPILLIMCFYDIQYILAWMIVGLVKYTFCSLKTRTIRDRYSVERFFMLTSRGGADERN